MLRAARLRPWAGRLGSFLFLAALAFAPGIARAQDDLPGRPRNSHPKPFGGGWECDRGYAAVGGSCAAIEVPSHAFLDSFGDGWDCLRGYREVEGACEIVQVPPNALLDFTGHRWDCARGFRKAEGECLAVQVPPNAHLD